MNNETGTISAKMHIGKQGKIIPCSVHPGGSIGYHKHETSDDINYVISGNGKAICDGQEEILYAGAYHICRKGSSHSIEIPETKTWFCLRLLWNSNPSLESFVHFFRKLQSGFKFCSKFPETFTVTPIRIPHPNQGHVLVQ